MGGIPDSRIAIERHQNDDYSLSLSLSLLLLGSAHLKHSWLYFRQAWSVAEITSLVKDPGQNLGCCLDRYDLAICQRCNTHVLLIHLQSKVWAGRHKRLCATHANVLYLLW